MTADRSQFADSFREAYRLTFAVADGVPVRIGHEEVATRPEATATIHAGAGRELSPEDARELARWLDDGGRP